MALIGYPETVSTCEKSAGSRVNMNQAAAFWRNISAHGATHHHASHGSQSGILPLLHLWWKKISVKQKKKQILCEKKQIKRASSTLKRDTEFWM